MIYVTIAVKRPGGIERRIIVVKDEDEFIQVMLRRRAPTWWRRINTVEHPSQPHIDEEVAVVIEETT